MFRDPEKRCWPNKINEDTATAIIVNAIEEHLGGEALDSEMEPGNLKTQQAMQDLEELIKVLWVKNARRSYNGAWDGLVVALEQSLLAKKEYLKEFNSLNKSERKECKAS